MAVEKRYRRCALGYGELECDRYALAMMPFEKFQAWQLCHELTLRVYSATRHWPADERYGLVSQARRAASSAPTNIAEGSAKRGSREFRRYLDSTVGSLAELAYHLRLARDLGYLTHAQWEELESFRARAGRATWALYTTVARSQPGNLRA
jgi:four helix bundle protein